MVPFEIGQMNSWETTGALVALGVMALVYLLAAGGYLWVTSSSPVVATWKTAQAVTGGTGIGLLVLIGGLLWYWASFSPSLYQTEARAWGVGAGLYLAAVLIAALASGVMSSALGASVRRSIAVGAGASIAFLLVPFVIGLLEFQTQCVTGITIWLRGALLCS